MRSWKIKVDTELYHATIYGMEKIELNDIQLNILKAFGRLQRPAYGIDLFERVQKHMEMTRGTYGPNLGKLVKHGMVNVIRCSIDAKHKLYTITEAGKGERSKR